MPIDGATITVRDSVGGGKTLKTVSSWSGTLINEDGTLADILADGYCFYDKDGNAVDISTIQADEIGWYNLYNVTVGEIE